MVVASTHLNTRFGRLSLVSSILRFVQSGKSFLRKLNAGFDFVNSIAATGDRVSSCRDVFSRSWVSVIVVFGIWRASERRESGLSRCAVGGAVWN